MGQPAAPTASSHVPPHCARLNHAARQPRRCCGRPSPRARAGGRVAARPGRVARYVAAAGRVQAARGVARDGRGARVARTRRLQQRRQHQLRCERHLLPRAARLLS
jgi:hypothetical protein